MWSQEAKALLLERHVMFFFNEIYLFIVSIFSVGAYGSVTARLMDILLTDELKTI